MANPRSKIYVCADVKLNKSQQHTIWFDTQTKQHEYFLSKVVKTFDDYTYLRKSWSIKVDSDYESASQWTYLCFRNGDVTTARTYFYFIDRVEYKSENTVELFLELDVMQTYLFDYDMLPCFVDREHVDSDAIGEHLIDEGLDVGEVVNNLEFNIPLSDLCILMASNVNPATASATVVQKVQSSIVGGVFSGLAVYATPIELAEDLGDMLLNLDTLGYSDGVVSMWMYPKNLITLKNGSWDKPTACMEVSGTKWGTFNASRNAILDGYIPSNKKLYTYPYNFIYVTNNDGASATYLYEKFDDPTDIVFSIVGSATPEAPIKLFPRNYKRSVMNNDEAIPGPSYPTCAWNQDIYKLWLAQNQHQLALNQTQAIITAGMGGIQLLTSLGQEGLDDVASGINSILGQIAMKKDKEIQPPQSKGKQSGNVNILTGKQTFTVIYKCVDNYHARIIDDFFTMYGYKCNRVKVPNRNVRASHTYVKTIGCQIKAREGKHLFNNEDITLIQSIYDKGVTFWKNGDRICEYGDNNIPL